MMDRGAQTCRRNAVALVAVVSLALLAGCHRAQPVRLQAPAPPPQWTAAAAPAGEVADRWWEQFEAPGLDALVREATERNFSLAAAAERVEAARQQARIAGADRWPRATAALSQGRQRQAFVGLPIPGRPGEVLITSTTRAALNLEVAWEADLWQRLRAQTIAARADAEAAEADLGAARLSLAARTAQAYFRAIEASRQLQLARSTAETFRLSAQQVRRRYQSGLRPSLDLRLALANASTAEAQVRQRAAQLDAALRQLELLAGRYPGASLGLPGSLPPLPPAVPAGVPADIVSRRLDVHAAESRVLAAEARVRQSRAALYPAFALTANGGFVSNQLEDVLQGRFGAWSLLGNLVQPVVQGGRLRANVRLQQARLREAQAAFADAVLQAFAEVELALAADRWLAEQQEEVELAARQAVAARELAQSRYDAGLQDIITVLEAQRRAFELESQLISVQSQRLQNRVELHLALGGGFGPTPSPPAPHISRVQEPAP